MGAALPTNAKTLSVEVQRFCLAHDDAFVVPAEALTEHGLDASFAALLLDAGRLKAEQLSCLELGFRLYWQRCADLFTRAPRSWSPPRQTNLLIVADASGVPSYLEPFRGTSSMLYMADLDTHAEYLALLLVHMERLSLLRSVPATMAYNLSYWFDRSPESRQAFARAARDARRPDAAGFVALADALGWIDQLLHDPLRVPAEQMTEPYFSIEGADLYVPKRLRSELMGLGESAEAALRSAIEASGRAPTARTTGSPGHALEELCDWLLQTRAHVIVHGPHGGTLWTPQHDDPIRVRRMLAGANEAAIASIHADLRVIDQRSRQFLARVRDVNALPTHCAVLETGGGAYVDAARRAVIYEVQQPAFDARAGSAPPYHRLLLGARVMHEWGHVAHAAKILYLPDDRRSEYTAARTELGERFAQVVERVPETFHSSIEAELQEIAPLPAERPAGLARKTLARIGDYLANMMCARLIPNEEMQAYVRTNVSHHADEQLGPVSELARYSYEVHYLDLVDLPRSYFYATSRFRDYYLRSGIFQEDAVEALFDAAGRVLACYAIDETRLTLPARAALPQRR